MRAKIRKILSYLLFAVVGTIAVAVASEWFIEVAKDKGWYDEAGQRWDLIMSATLSFLSSPIVYIPVVGLAGIVAGLWLDVVLRKFETRRQKDPPSIDWKFLQDEIQRLKHIFAFDLAGQDDVADGYSAVSQEAVTGFYALLFYMHERSLTPISGIPSPKVMTDDDTFFEVSSRYLAAIEPFVRAKNPDAIRHFGQGAIDLAYSLLTEKREKTVKPEPQPPQ